MWVNLILAVIFLLAAPLVWFLLADYSGRYVAWIANLANHRDPGLRAHYEVVSRFADKIPRLTATMVVVLSMWFAHMTVVYLRFHKLYQQGRLLVSDPKTPPSEPTTGGR